MLSRSRLAQFCQYKFSLLPHKTCSHVTLITLHVNQVLPQNSLEGTWRLNGLKLKKVTIFMKLLEIVLAVFN